ncbi:hypothetical protein FN846DRAFT_1002154 [Sphaerosporella brunnea]|uniref:Uncharacterized protein n=1 Tax=Sphaerosporella brunnea TaxID=1250544 RepID=A0A5J5EFA2_9PEZI|nr:hypothetical protein FN846DRAFT_1002154 [Sphaerosporella brunnea]
MRVNYGGSIAISVTTDGIGINYKHRPIHQRAAVWRVDKGLKDIIRTKQFASAHELRRCLQHNLRNDTLYQYTVAQLYYWWAFFNQNNYCRYEDEFISCKMLLANSDEDGFNIIPALTKREVSLAWILPFCNDNVVDVTTSMSLPFSPRIAIVTTILPPPVATVTTILPPSVATVTTILPLPVASVTTILPLPVTNFTTILSPLVATVTTILTPPVATVTTILPSPVATITN